jgi:hypothetical protein
MPGMPAPPPPVSLPAFTCIGLLEGISKRNNFFGLHAIGNDGGGFTTFG